MELNIKGASKDEILKKLFLSTLYLSAFTFGGGYVIVTLMKTKFVDQYHWIDEEEMLDLVAIAQSHILGRKKRRACIHPAVFINLTPEKFGTVRSFLPKDFGTLHKAGIINGQ